MSQQQSEPKRIGRKIFPNQQTSEIRNSSNILHYQPPPEPPIDYTIRVPSTDRDYRVSRDVFQRPPPFSSPDFESEEQFLTSSSSFQKKETIEEILDELDQVLFEASIPFDELKKKVENFNISFKPYPPEIQADDLPEIPYSKQPKKVAGGVSHSSRFDDYKSVEFEDRTNPVRIENAEIDRKYAEVLERIEIAKKQLSPEHFRRQYEKDGIPSWKRSLLAEKRSKSEIQKFEHEIWLEYEHFRQKAQKKHEKNEKIKRSKSIQLGGGGNAKKND